jgi:hypothetical protein
MLEFGACQRTVFRTCPVNHPDVLVRVGDTMNVEKAWGDQRARSRFGGRRAVSDQLDFQPALLARLSQSGLFRIFIEFNVPAEGEPLVQLAMVYQQDPAVLHNKNGHCKIDLFVNVRHARPTVEQTSWPGKEVISNQSEASNQTAFR